MEAKELRIGNYVSTNNITIQTHEILAEDISSMCNGSFNKYVLEIIPIPLTEEWLVKFGFEGVKVYGKNNFDEYRKEILQLSITPNGYEIFYTYRWIRINHVHQLQNLYFALTGEELTIK